VALRFQDKDDEVDREVEESKQGLGCLVLGAVLFGAFYFAWDVFISGRSINWAYRDMGGFAVFVFVGVIMERLVVPKYQEFRIRTKEILGRLTEIEKTVSMVKGDQKELLERLSAIDDELRSLRYEK